MVSLYKSQPVFWQEIPLPTSLTHRPQVTLAWLWTHQRPFPLNCQHIWSKFGNSILGTVESHGKAHSLGSGWLTVGGGGDIVDVRSCVFQDISGITSSRTMITTVSL